MDGAQRDELERGIALYNKGNYFDAQEPLEDLLRVLEGVEQALVRALLMLAAAMHLHFHRGGGRGTLNLIRQSLMLLDDLRPDCAGVATGDLYEAMEAYLQDLQDRKKPGAGFFDRWLVPRISYR